MARTELAIVLDGKLYPARERVEVQARDEPRPIAARQTRNLDAYTKRQSVGGVEEVADLLGRVVRRIQEMDEDQAHRARELMHAAISLANATSVLPASDQELFEAALRNA